MARKVFISVLGYSNYGACHYIDTENNFKSTKVRFVQEASLQYLCSQEEWQATDAAYILLTKGAHDKNWVDDGQCKYGSDEPIIQPGLESCLHQMRLSFPVIPLQDLPEGKDEDEIWQIFERVFEVLKEEDELYFDLTHGFRYLPMLILVLGNYAKFLKQVKIKSIIYGNFELRDKQTEEAPFINLMPLTMLQDWTFAAADYLENGNVKRLQELTQENIKPLLIHSMGKDKKAFNLKQYVESLSKVVADFQTCRGKNILSGKHLSLLQDRGKQLEANLITPLVPVIDKIQHVFLPYRGTDQVVHIKNGLLAAQWCYNNHMYQQAVTILQETVISFFCKRYGVQIDNVSKRDLISYAFKLATEESPIIHNGPNYLFLTQIVGDLKNINSVIISSFNRLREIRNDFNHFGIRSADKVMKPMGMINKIKLSLDTFSTLESDVIGCVLIEERRFDKDDKSILLNISNHFYSDWSEKQKNAAIQFGECIDLQFPAIDPEADKYAISTLADQFIDQISILYNPDKTVVHLMGEMTFLYSLLVRLKRMGYKVIASTTNRIVQQIGKDQKEVRFDFIRFREYSDC